MAAEARQTVAAEPVLEALCATDRDNRAADQAFSDAAGDVTAMTEVVRNQISFIEVSVLRVPAVLGLSMPATEAGCGRTWPTRWSRAAHSQTP